jgi:hypothetical protein
MRGGPLLGGKRGLYDTFVGATTRYVINKAPCRVILTAPPGDAEPHVPLPPEIERFAPPPTGDPTQPAEAAAENGGISDPDAAEPTPAQ